MEKEFIPYEQALALKELGFDEECLMYWNDYGKQAISRFQLLNRIDSWCINYIEAPLFSQAFRWFREKYELSCSVGLTDNSRHFYFDFTISDSKNRDYNDEDCFDSCKRIYDDGKFGTHEEAELECLKKLIEIVKK